MEEVLLILIAGGLGASLFIAWIISTNKRYRQKIESIIGKSNSKNWQDRVHAVREANTFLEKNTDKRIIQLLLGALKDEEQQVRLEAAMTFAQKIDAKVKIVNDEEPVISRSMKSLVVDALIHALEDGHSGVRRNAAEALGKAGAISRVIAPLIKALGDPDQEVCRSVIMALKKGNDIRAINPLLNLLKGEHRFTALRALEKLCVQIWKIVFGHNRVGGFDQYDTLYNPNLSELTVPMPKLKNIVIHTKSCDLKHIEALAHYASKYIEEKQFRKRIRLSIYGNLGKFPSDFYKVFSICKHVEVDIETLIFGSTTSTAYRSYTTWHNPDSSELTLPLSHLKQIAVYPETSNFFLLEQFLTYAVNYIGQKYLKKHVRVHIYGDLDKLHQNLYNNFTNLCKDVVVHNSFTG